MLLAKLLLNWKLRTTQSWFWEWYFSLIYCWVSQRNYLYFLILLEKVKIEIWTKIKKSQTFLKYFRLSSKAIVITKPFLVFRKCLPNFFFQEQKTVSRTWKPTGISNSETNLRHGTTESEYRKIPVRNPPGYRPTSPLGYNSTRIWLLFGLYVYKKYI